MILGIILNAIATILHWIIFIYTWVIIISALISWVRPDPYNPIVQILHKLTEPVYERIRRKIPLVFNGLDLTPLVLLLILQFIDMTLVKILFSYAESF